jgi:hypothetical protein
MGLYANKNVIINKIVYKIIQDEKNDKMLYDYDLRFMCFETMRSER